MACLRRNHAGHRDVYQTTDTELLAELFPVDYKHTRLELYLEQTQLGEDVGDALEQCFECRALILTTSVETLATKPRLVRCLALASDLGVETPFAKKLNDYIDVSKVEMALRESEWLDTYVTRWAENYAMTSKDAGRFVSRSVLAVDERAYLDEHLNQTFRLYGA